MKKKGGKQENIKDENALKHTDIITLDPHLRK